MHPEFRGRSIPSSRAERRFFYMNSKIVLLTIRLTEGCPSHMSIRQARVTPPPAPGGRKVPRKAGHNEMKLHCREAPPSGVELPRAIPGTSNGSCARETHALQSRDMGCLLKTSRGDQHKSFRNGMGGDQGRKLPGRSSDSPNPIAPDPDLKPCPAYYEDRVIMKIRVTILLVRQAPPLRSLASSSPGVRNPPSALPIALGYLLLLPAAVL